MSRPPATPVPATAPTAPTRPARSGGAILGRGCALYVAAVVVGSLSAGLTAGLLGTHDLDVEATPPAWLLAELASFVAGTTLVLFVAPALWAARRR